MDSPSTLFPCQVLQHRMARFCAQPRRPHPQGRARFSAMQRFSMAHLAHYKNAGSVFARSPEGVKHRDVLNKLRISCLASR